MKVPVTELIGMCNVCHVDKLFTYNGSQEISDNLVYTKPGEKPLSLPVYYDCNTCGGTQSASSLDSSPSNLERAVR
jgi:hypothetical protein